MSDDFNPALAAIPETPDEAEETLDLEEDSSNVSSSSTTRRARRKTKAAKKRELLALEKMDCLKHLIQAVDTLIYTELFILYYMDCSFFRLLIRAFAQLILFTPTGPRAIPITVDRPYTSAIFIPNFLCLLLHTITARPEAGETMRGYLHGGIIMDLIGQKGPTSKTHLILLDLLVLGLQCFLLAVNEEYKVLDSYVKEKKYKNDEMPATGMVVQNHDAEERGVFRRVSGTTSNDIELQDITHRSTNPRDSSENFEDVALHGEAENDDPQNPLLTTHSPEDSLQERLDLHYSGIAITAEFHILHTLRSQYRRYKTRAEMVSAFSPSTQVGAEARRIRTGELPSTRLASVSTSSIASVILARAIGGGMNSA